MVREKVIVSTKTLQWKCADSRADSKRLHYGRFIVSPLWKGQADIIAIAMRRTLLGEIEGTCITRAKSEKIPHEYSSIAGIQESVHEILLNLQEIVLRSHLYGTCDAAICAKGPGNVTAQDIIAPPFVEIIDNTQHIATLTEPIDLCIFLKIERSRGYRTTGKIILDGSYPIGSIFMPVQNVNHSIHSYGTENEKQEILFLEIWTNGSLTPKEALREATQNLIDFFIPFLHTEEENFHLEDNQHMVPLRPSTHSEKLTKNKKKIASKSIFIDQSELPSRVYNCLQSNDIYTLSDLMTNKEQDLMRMEHLRAEDIKKISDILDRNFGIDFPN
uniref:RNA polymerase alpha subunit n=1 Tax=Pseudocodon convolvulaceus TaxID=1392590 RepID=UPI001BEF71EB|nr:RNA polymerase alpha subunit [Pseudocodon convolvulaceus]QTZ17964.1 RNA polymerase alpha subunit [Pseudocodon vinciflorus]UIG86696.1 RNA polymerase alpha subunit [Pseudocodon convolvulaceus]